MNIFEELKRRGLIAQMTNEEKVKEKLLNEQVTFYIGFDATADSLHVGHFLQLVIMKRMQMAGHRPIALLGTGTTMVGDPTGKTEMRSMLTVDDIRHNAECFKRQMEKFIDFSEGKALMLENGEWLLNLNYIQLLREVGVHFSVNRMLTAECVKSRLEKGLSFLEFNYMIMQGYDFWHLSKHYNCEMQFGGDDQWSNILWGIDLTRRIENKEVFGVTFTLLTTKEGKKMGKTEKGALWLDPEKTTPYEFFQYWRNVDDADVINCLKLLTFVPIEEIEAMEKLEGSQLNACKERLAVELTTMVHGEEEASKALDAAKSLFGGGADSSNIPVTEVGGEIFTDSKISLLDLLVLTALAPSKSEARRLVQQGGISVNEEKIGDINAIFGKEVVEAGLLIKKGKKVFHRVVMK